MTSQLDVAWAGDRFVAPLGDSVATSPDGVRWDRERFTRFQGGKGTGGAKLSWDGRRLFGEGFWWLIPHGPEKLAPAARGGLDARGRRWRTDLELLNLGGEPRTCELELRVPGAVGDPPRRSVTVPGGNALRVEDVLGLFGYEGLAAVEVLAGWDRGGGGEPDVGGHPERVSGHGGAGPEWSTRCHRPRPGVADRALPRGGSGRGTEDVDRVGQRLRHPRCRPRWSFSGVTAHPSVRLPSTSTGSAGTARRPFRPGGRRCRGRGLCGGPDLDRRLLGPLLGGGRGGRQW